MSAVVRRRSTPRLVIARLSFKEAVSRRLVVAGLALSVAFVLLFVVGFVLLTNFIARNEVEAPEQARTLAAMALTVLGLYMVQFLAAFLAIFLSVGSVSGEAASGILHGVLAKPLARRSWLLQRWGAFAALAVGYVTLMAGSLLLTARVVVGYQPLSATRAVALMALQVLVLMALGVWGSTRLPTLGNGVLVFSLFGLAWLAGIIEFVGEVFRNTGMQNLGVAVSLVVPSDALWRGASYYLQSPVTLAVTNAASDVTGNPFASGSPPAGPMVVWAVAYVAVLLALAVRRFGRTDL